MNEKLKLIGFIVGIPAIVIVVVFFVARNYENQWQSAALENLGGELGEVSIELEEGVEIKPLREMCTGSDDITELEGPCANLTVLSLMNRAAWASAIIGVLLISAISFAGRRANHDRDLLLKLFRPGLYVTIFCVTALTLVHAVLAIGAIYYAESAFLGRLHVGIILAIALGAAVGVYGMAKTVFATVHDATASVFGSVLTREQHPGIWKFVDDTAQRVGTDPPQHLVAGLDPTFFVTEASVTSLDGELQGRTLYLSLPLCRILSQAETASVVGHELAHFKGEDTIYSKKFYPIYRGAGNALVGMVRAGSEWARTISLLPAIYALSHFLDSFGAAENKLGRERELAADQVGAEAAGIGGHKAMGSALVKIHAFVSQWSGATNRFTEDPQNAESVSALFEKLVHESSKPEALEGLDEHQVPHPTDTHPYLSTRLKSLRLKLEEVSSEALQTAPKSRSIDLIDSHLKLEQRLSERWSERIQEHSAEIEPPSFAPLEA